MTLEILNRMRDFDRYFYKTMKIESYIEYDQDHSFKEYSVHVDNKLHTFASVEQVLKFIKDYEAQEANSKNDL